MTIGAALDEYFSQQARERKAQAPGQPQGTKKVSGGKLPQETGKTRDKVAQAIGMSGQPRIPQKALFLRYWPLSRLRTVDAETL